ncbi:T9SS type A sorting domain-containing protein [Flavobacterium psychrotrophum]|uniref:T9SS type A sorting domain-containing protein n=1 Tax=Flavobacterium psychrotrophum TaxID=2294119 RepID=UPI000E30CBC8|nr:T9SS type A sorting domain-containing protein [Flavobacterium psychrotrophum]
MKKTATLLKSLLFLCLLTGFQSFAQSITVSNTNDSGAGSFRQAVADIAAGGAILFSAGANGTITLQSAITINKSITINGNGDDDTVFSGADNSQIFVVTNAQMLTINNVGFTNGSATVNGGAISATGSTILINNAAFTNNKAAGATAGQGGGAIYAEGGALTVNASSFTGNDATGAAGSGGAVLIGAAGNFTANGTTFSENTANRAGGAIEGNSGANTTITLTDVTLDENTTGANPGNGGGLHITGAGNTVITGGTVSENTAAAEGGGLWNGSGTMTLQSVTITGNIASGAGADQGGGGIYNLSGILTVNTGTEITGNIANGAAGSGGGILNDAGGRLTVNGALISDNTSNRAGGGIEDNSGANGQVTLTNITLTDNVTNNSPGNGGGLHVTGAGTVSISGGTVSGNEAGAEGGGLWNGTGTMNIDGTLITNNTASGALADQGGGGIYNLNGGTVTIINATISNNVADGAAGSGGGILNDVGSQLSVTDTEISGNTAARAGGGIEDNSGTSTIVLTNVDLINNSTGSSPGNGGGLHITGAGSATITGGVVRGNSAVEGGGLWNATGTLTVNGVYITANIARGATITDGGGGIFNNGGTLVVNKSTIAANTATGLLGRGGGIHVNGGTAAISGSTISGNTSIANGGGIYSTGTLTVNANTITLNSATVSGGGIYHNAATAATIKNTIVSGNIALISGRDLFSDTAAIVSGGYNLVGFADSDDFTSNENDITGTLLAPAVASLLPLTDAEDGLPYHAFDCPSAAADMGDPADTFNDQLGMSVFNNRRDIGAYEAQELCSTASTADFASLKSMVFPNPSVGGLLNVQLAQNHTGDAQIAVYELATGKIIQQAKADGSLTTLGLQDVATGTYIVKITSDTATETHKVMVNR